MRAQLARNERVQALGGNKADIFLLPGFLTRQQCAKLIDTIEARLGPSTLFHDSRGSAARTSSTHFFAAGEPLTEKLRRKICDLLGLDPSYAEPTQGQRYLPGQEYRHHFDFFREKREHWQTERLRGGQRTWTAMVYLDRVEAGGATEFPRLELSVDPEPGLLICWDNMYREGRPNQRLLHAGMPVEAGEKHVVTQWFRLEPWRSSSK